MQLKIKIVRRKFKESILKKYTRIFLHKNPTRQKNPTFFEKAMIYFDYNSKNTKLTWNIRLSSNLKNQ